MVGADRGDRTMTIRRRRNGLGMENEMQEGWINTGFVAHARAGGPCKHSPPDQHTSRAKVSSLLIGVKEH